MKKIYFDKKKREVKLKIENTDDLWFLSEIIDDKDVVSGQTTRKIKIGDSNDRKQSIVKKTIFISIEVEKVEFHKYSDILRVSGLIVSAPEDIPKGSHHTISIEKNSGAKNIIEK